MTNECFSGWYYGINKEQKETSDSSLSITTFGGICNLKPFGGNNKIIFKKSLKPYVNQTVHK